MQRVESIPVPTSLACGHFDLRSFEDVNQARAFAWNLAKDSGFSEATLANLWFSFQELLTNAVRYGVETSPTHEAAHVTFFRGQDWIGALAQDHGRGIPAVKKVPVGAQFSQPPAGPEETHNRGLQIIDGFASSVLVATDDQHTDMWVCVEK